MSLKFEWDQNKSDRCFTERGFDFKYASLAFLDPSKIISEDNRHDYGEKRYTLLGVIEGRIFHIVFTCRDDVFRIISPSKANNRESNFYVHNKV